MMSARSGAQKLYLTAESGHLLQQEISGNNNEKICILADEPVEGQQIYIVTEDQLGSVLLQMAESNSKAAGDEELTSLSWLQNNNLLQGINLSAPTNKAEAKSKLVRPDNPEILPQEAPEESEADSSWDGSDASSPDGIPLAQPMGEEVGVSSKPPHSFSALIFLAIESSASKAMPVRDIYNWITQHFPYYQHAPVGWKNSVRHNLSLNKCFYKVECGLNMSKGSFWMVDPAHRPQLIQSLGKVSYIKPDLIQKLINEPKVLVSATSSSATKRKLAKAEPLLQASPKAFTVSPPSSSTSSASSTSSHRSNVPDPKLFPYLSRRLAFSNGLVENSDPDVDVAQAMLALATSDGRGIISQPVPDSPPPDDHTYSFTSPRYLPAPGKRTMNEGEPTPPTSNVTRKLETSAITPPLKMAKRDESHKTVRTRGGRAKRR